MTTAFVIVRTLQPLYYGHSSAPWPIGSEISMPPDMATELVAHKAVEYLTAPEVAEPAATPVLLPAEKNSGVVATPMATQPPAPAPAVVPTPLHTPAPVPTFNAPLGPIAQS